MKPEPYFPVSAVPELAEAIGSPDAGRLRRLATRRPLDLDAMTSTAMVRSVQEVAHDFHVFATNPEGRFALGIEWVDDVMRGGTAPGEVTCLLAPSGTGKTTILINAIVNNPTTPGLFFSIEMSDRMVVARAYAIAFEEEYKSLERRLKGGDPELERRLLGELAERLPRLGLVDRGGISVRDMDRAIGEYAEVFGERPAYVMIDYLDLIGGGAEGVEQAKRKFVDLRELAKAHGLAVIVAHQVKGEVLSDRHGEPLRYNDGRYAGATESDHLVAAFRRVNSPRVQADPERYERERWTICFQVLKTRSGEPHPMEREHGWNPYTLRITDEPDVIEKNRWEPPPPPSQRAASFLQQKMMEDERQ